MPPLQIARSSLLALVLIGLGSPDVLAQSSHQASPQSLPQRLLRRPGAVEVNSSLESTSFNSTYILNTGDQLEITVLGYEEYTGAKVVLPDGTVSLPLIGVVTVTGKTVQQVTAELKQRLDAFLVDPTVTVNLLTLRPVIVTVSGAVMRPGSVELRSITAANSPSITTQTATGTSSATTVTTSSRPPTVSSAIVAAGGIMRDADLRNVTIQRRNLDGSVASSPSINLWDAALSTGDMPNLLLQDGDIVSVPRLAASDLTNQREFARSALAPETVRVRVVGEVNRPGEVQIPPNGSISSAVASAGGPTTDARLSQVAFIRPDANGQIDPQIIDLRTFKDTQQIQEGDLIVVPKRGSASVLDFINRILPALGLLIPIF
jgi:polysaccharide biosynthesis/export protein